MPTVRNDFFKLGEKFVTVIGDDVKVGDMAPEFTSAAQDWKPINPVAESKGKVAILSAVPSLDTDTCDRETRRFNEEAAKLSDDIIVWTISTDFPFAQKRWCGASSVDKIITASDHRDGSFGKNYGLLISGGPLDRVLARAVFVVGADNKFKHVEYVGSIGEHPNYEAVFAASK